MFQRTWRREVVLAEAKSVRVTQGKKRKEKKKNLEERGGVG
jgi:hypothetical protein